jgi:hypothetical protein
VEGYKVVSLDDKPIGRISGVVGDFYIVERGALWKSRLPLPKRYAKVDPDARSVRAGLSKQVLCAAPKVRRDGTLDEEAATSFFGLT